MFREDKRTDLLEKLELYGRYNLADDCFKRDLFDQSTEQNATARINETLLKSGVLFEKKSLTLLPLPFVFSEHLKRNLEKKFIKLHKIIERIPALYYRSSKVRDFFRLPKMIDEFIHINCNVDPNVFLCRYDFSLTKSGSPRIYELNAASPAALSFSPYFYQAVTSTDLFHQLQSSIQYNLSPFISQRSKIFMKNIRDFVNEKFGKTDPTIGIVNSRINTMVNELNIMENEAVEIGLKVVRAYIEDLTFKEGRLLAEDTPIDAMFAKIDALPGVDFECPITRNRRDIEPLLEGIQSGVPYLNPFCSSSLIDNKSILAFLQSNLADEILDNSDRILIDEIVPETRLLHHLDLKKLSEVAQKKEEWVLKKSLDTRGRSVVIGKTVSSDDWVTALERAKGAASENYVIQRFEAPEYCLSGGEPLFTSHAYFMLRGLPCGAFTRTSKSLITNVGSGGAVQVSLIG